MAKICLNMIVKNESAIIEKMLKSLPGVIDCYVICDTGSTDNTVEIIQSFFSEWNISGTIHHIPFVSFDQARNAALQFAQQSTMDFDYILLTDADMECRVMDPAFKNMLNQDCYLVRQQDAWLSYHNIRLVKKSLPAHYVGVTHEYLHVDAERTFLDGFYFYDHTNGGNRPEKYERDVRLLTEGLKQEPGNSRYVFYLAQTYFDMGNYPLAEEFYQKRILMNDWVEEVYYAYYRLGMIAKILERPEADILQAFLNAYSYRPLRAEPLFELAHYYRCKQKWANGYLFAKTASEIAIPASDILFVSKDVYDYKALDELAVCAYWLGKYKECQDLCQSLLVNPHVPLHEMQRIFNNLYASAQSMKSPAILLQQQPSNP